jgi:hypothetical protein
MADPRHQDKPPTTKWQIDRLDGRERRFSFIAAGASVLFGLAIYLVQTNNHKFRLAKGQITPQTTLVLGIVCGVLLLLATLLGRRAPVGFVALFTFLAFGTADFALGAPFLVLAGWLLYRSYKLQKEAAASLRKANANATSPNADASNGRRTPAAKGGTPRATATRTKAKGPSSPEANKRYTPKRPPPPPVKPSRRDRKAAQASD